jgi:Ni,Fe-hydrogenase III large subunit
MDIDMTRKDAKCLEESVDRLTDEHKAYFLGVLEALTFAQRVKETAALEPKGYNNEKLLR